VTVKRAEEAWKYNAMAVVARPNDALAHSQLGTNCFELGDLAAAAKELERARGIDRAHFSHPQLLLAQIYVRQGDKSAAVTVLEEFLRYHPDWPQGPQLRAKIAELRK
jgi:tetratricopeptide (TPR) repeat protein